MPLPESPVALVINTHSRKAERFFFKVLDALIERGVDVRDLFPIRDPEKLDAAVQTAIERGCRTVIVGGGDGTISALMKHFVGIDVTLGILPLGTANSFIRSLAIPSDPAEAIRVISQGKAERIDVGKVNDRYFANAISFGFTTLVATHLSHGLKRRLGIFAYVVEGVRQSLKARPFALTVRHGGIEETFRTYQTIVANGSFYGPSKLSDTATVNNGGIVILTMKRMRRRSLLLAWLRSIFGGDLRHATSQTLKVDKATIKARPNQSVSIDGEIARMDELSLSVVPEAVRVIVPQSFRKLDRIPPKQKKGAE